MLDEALARVVLLEKLDSRDGGHLARVRCQPEGVLERGELPVDRGVRCVLCLPIDCIRRDAIGRDYDSPIAANKPIELLLLILDSVAAKERAEMLQGILDTRDASAPVCFVVIKQSSREITECSALDVGTDWLAGRSLAGAEPEQFVRIGLFG